MVFVLHLITVFLCLINHLCVADSVATNEVNVSQVQSGSNCSDKDKTSNRNVLYTEASNPMRSHRAMENDDVERQDGVGSNEDDDLSILADSGSDEYRPSDSSSSNEDAPRIKKKKSNRWRKSDPTSWTKNKAKVRRKSGKPYATKNGMNPGKSPKRVDCSKCRWKCTENFDEQARKKLCSEYWQLDYCRQKDFIANNVSSVPPKTRRVRTGTGKRKESSRVFYFVKENVKCRVCKEFFLKTLCISHGPLETALSGVSELGVFTGNDQRGRHEPQNKTKPEVMETVKLHIESFPKMESHYCRKSTKREYLDPQLSINKMYELYVEHCKQKAEETKIEEPVVSQITYRRIFCQNYNLSFFKPKKDQCIMCNNYSDKQLRDENMKTEFEAHLKRRDEANSAKEAHKQRANNDKTFVSVTFDLQSVLQIPASNDSAMYYSRKISVYNLTVYEAAEPHKAYCFAWSELNGQRGSCEIGTALLQWIKQLPDTVTEISLFSDTCSGQNRNQFISALFLYVVQNTNLQIVEHNFMEKGHSYMEVDSMHSAIETARKNVKIYTMNDWLNVFRLARSRRGKNKTSGKYIVKELLHSDMINLKDVAGNVIKNRTIDNEGQRVNWLKVKVLRYEKDKPGLILFKYNHSDQDFKSIRTAGRGRPVQMPRVLPSLYQTQLSISEAKKKDLLKLCAAKAIPQELQEWYASLPVDKKKRDCAPEPANLDSEDSSID